MIKQDEPDNQKIARFPSAAEREALKRAQSIPSRREPVLNLPPVVQALCLINCGVFLIEKLLPGLMTDDQIYNLSFVPERYFSTESLDYAGIISPITHMFIHVNWLHLLMNVGTLMAFGAGLERALGGRKLLLLYFTTGLFGAALHTLVYPHMEAPMIGASGAISGLFGAVLMMLYTQGSMGNGYRRLLPFVFIWVGTSVFFGIFGMPGVDNPIAWTTHIGGFAGGLLFYRPIKRLKIR